MAILIDSWAWIEYFRGTAHGEKVKNMIDSSGEFIISVVNATEVYRHFLAQEGPAGAERVLGFMLGAAFSIPVNLSTAVLAAKLKHEKKIGLGGSLIMAAAEEHQAQILTGDPDFKLEANVIYIGK